MKPALGFDGNRKCRPRCCCGVPATNGTFDVSYWDNRKQIICVHSWIMNNIVSSAKGIVGAQDNDDIMDRQYWIFLPSCTTSYFSELHKPRKWRLLWSPSTLTRAPRRRASTGRFAHFWPLFQSEGLPGGLGLVKWWVWEVGSQLGAIPRQGLHVLPSIGKLRHLDKWSFM